MRRLALALLLAGALASALLLVVAAGRLSLALPATTERVSVDSAGNQGHGFSGAWDITADGRCVAFASAAVNLLPDDTNAAWDVFVHDRGPGPPVGGIAQLADLPHSPGDIMVAVAGLAAPALIILILTASYARRRLS